MRPRGSAWRLRPCTVCLHGDDYFQYIYIYILFLAFKHVSQRTPPIHTQPGWGGGGAPLASAETRPAFFSRKRLLKKSVSCNLFLFYERSELPPTPLLTTRTHRSRLLSVRGPAGRGPAPAPQRGLWDGGTGAEFSARTVTLTDFFFLSVYPVIHRLKKSLFYNDLHVNFHPSVLFGKWDSSLWKKINRKYEGLLHAEHAPTSQAARAPFPSLWSRTPCRAGRLVPLK